MNDEQVLLGIIKVNASQYSSYSYEERFTRVLNEWKAQAQQMRVFYNQLYNKFQLNPSLTTNVDPQQNNPLAPTSNV
jgi:hypothetical protein